MRRRVVITGMGAVPPLGHNVSDLYASQIEGRSGVGPITHFDARTFPTTFAAQVKDFDLGRFFSGTDRWTHCGLNTRFALAAAKQALADGNLLDNHRVDRTNVGIYLGSGEGSHDFKHLVECTARATPDGFKVDNRAFYALSRKSFTAAHEYEMEMQTTAAHLAETFDLQGPNYTCQTACAASSQAIGEA